MRLIDTDEFEVISWNAQGQTAEYERGYDDGIAFMAERIDRAPTIDAIPVEWLLRKRKEALQEGMRPDEVESVELVLWMWQKEREAR